ncbi:LegC family aminotransferase [Geobacter sp. DSM 9736]|uniref:LegC family aminotransferase n=1 Tax=Geobacter sp. DSM 9736 TaxID=1277350 RepID=UPI000B508269|nr:LegC family aminotransferase [Geobacter sp. DSM 9736]SNB45038.1 perosamine synthetase [Geobacter sp. DSM 9736]
MRKSIVEPLVEALRTVLPPVGAVSLHEPCFTGNEWNYVKECLDTGWVSSVGKFVDRFEEELASFTGANCAIAVVNGTAALHVCLLLAGVLPGDEVLIPSLTFIATANAVSYCGAVPHFVDSNERTLGLDPVKLEQYLAEIVDLQAGSCYNRKTGRRIRAVVPMHTFGHPVDLDALVDVCERFCVELVEDAAESIGSYYKGKHTGNHGRLAALSFNGNKTITTGGGGAVITNDEELGRLAKHLTTTAKVPHPWKFNHDMVGFNYRLPNLNAALGCAQLEQLPRFLAAKRQLFETYHGVLRGFEGVRLMSEPEFTRSNYWLQAIILDECIADQRDIILERTNARGIMTRPCWTLMQNQPMFTECPRMETPVAQSLERRLINIPSSAILTDVAR